MDPLDFLEHEQLLYFLHRQKTELSLMEKPQTFLRQLRDYDLIPDELFQKVTRMRTKENIQRGVYTALDWFERNRPKCVHRFWNCAFRDSIRNQYPTLKQLHTSLMDGSFKFNSQLPEKEEEEEEEECEKKIKKQQKRKSECEDDEEEEKEKAGSVKKKLKKKKRTGNCINDDDEEEAAATAADPQPGPSGQLTPSQKKKSKKVFLYSPLKKGEQNDIWTWPIYKTQLPVTCGSEEGTLSRERLAKGEKCLLFQKQWFYPGDFERLAGKEQCKNWKVSIKCRGTTLDKLFQDGHLETGGFPRRHKQTRRTFVQVVEEISDDAAEAEKGEELTVRLPQGSGVFEVTCGDVAATLHQRRFATGTIGKCIRTETKWLSPENFVKEATGRSDAKWKKDILYRGRPLAQLMGETLKIHLLTCECYLCDPDETCLEDQKNDDVCCVCKRDSALVVCEKCPRSFHQKCHLPQIPPSIIEDKTCPWWCTFCVTSQSFVLGQEKDMKTALSQPISNQLSKCHRLILYLYCADDKQTFKDSEDDAPAPTWLREVEHKLQNEEYESVKEFEEDVRRMIRRCAANNPASHEFPALKLFQAEFKKVLNIVE